MNKYIARAFRIALLMACVSREADAGEKGTSIQLSKDSVPLYQILLAPMASDPERNAASELSRYLKVISGADFPVIHDIKPGGMPVIAVGSGAATMTAPEIKPKIGSLGPDGIYVGPIENHLILTGSPNASRGTLYAVYDFLQKEAGCRWYAKDVEKIPKQASLSVEVQARIYQPPFLFRETFTEPVKDPMVAFRMKQNGRQFLEPIPDEFGGSLTLGGAHTIIRQFLNPEKYFEANPEWYALDKNTGKRSREAICMSSESGTKELITEALTYLEENPKTRILNISSNDNAITCSCDNCKKLRGREGGESELLFRLVNAVAAATKEKYPDLLISTLAYWTTDKPPIGITLEKNILVIFAPLDRNHKLSIPDCLKFREYLKQWSKLASHLYVWDYDANFSNYVMPHPNHFISGDSIRFFAENRVSGVFWQGSWGKFADFSAMRAWVVSQLLWEPKLDERKLIEEFLQAYYGAAAPYLMEYLDLLNSAVNRSPSLFLGAYDKDSKGWLTLDELNAATSLLEKARAALSDESAERIGSVADLIDRLATVKTGLDLEWIDRFRELRATALDEGKPFLGPNDPYRYIENLEKSGLLDLTHSEDGTMRDYVNKLRERFPEQNEDLPIGYRGLNRLDWINVQESRTITGSNDGAETAVEDMNASDHKAIKLIANTPCSEAKLEIPSYWSGKYRILIELRSPDSGGATAVSASIFQKTGSGSDLMEMARKEKLIGDTYEILDLGVHRLQAGASVRVQPNGSKEGSPTVVLLDRILLLHSK